MNTRKFSGDMADQVEKDRGELVDLRESNQLLITALRDCVESLESCVKYGVKLPFVLSSIENGRSTLERYGDTAWEKRDE